MSIYSQSEVNDLYEQASLAHSEFIACSDSWFSKQLNAKARNYLLHGFLRRMSTLRHCIQKIYKICPPETVRCEKENLVDTTVYLQAFLINAFGAIDNLCHILNEQLSFNLSPSEVGLGRRYSNFKNKLSNPLKEYLSSLDSWLSYLLDYRHALAHRIPIYIPPHIVDPSNSVEYLQLQNEWYKALSTGDDEAVQELNLKMEELSSFHPIMVHDFLGEQNSIFFHSQILADWSAVLELSRQFLKEID